MVELLTIDGEEFEIMCITPDLYEESEELFMYVFPNFGNMCLCTNLKEAPEAMEELRKLMRAVLNDGISFAARHRATDQLVGICCNKIINNKKNITLDEALKNLKSPEMLAIDAYFELLENGYDIFKEWQVESAFEIEFLAVHPAWGKRGLGFSILSHALDFAHAMAKGELRPDQMAHVSKQIREEQPQVAMGLFTSFYTQKMNVKKNISLQTVVESFKSQPMLTIIENVLRLEDGFDIFKEWQVDCAFEVEFLAIHPDWCNRGLGYSICCYVMQFAQAMARGELTPQQMAPLSVEIREERPELVMGILTSLYAEKLGSKLKCMCVNIAAVSGLDADGNIVDPEHENLRFAARRL